MRFANYVFYSEGPYDFVWNNFDAKESDLFISECMVNPGPVYKRVKFASRGNVDRRDKRTSHIIVRVSDGKGGNN